MNTKNLQNYLILKSLQTNLYDAVAGAINRLLPGFEIDTDEEGNYVRGADIPNATYAQRIACNFLAPVKLWNTYEQCQSVIAKQKWNYDPDSHNALGEAITPSENMAGNSYHIIPFVRVEGVDDTLKDARDAWKQATGLTLDYPEGYSIDGDALKIYFKPPVEPIE